MNLDLQLQQIMPLWTLCKFRSWEAMTKLKIITTLTYLGLQPSLRHKKGCGWENVSRLSHIPISEMVQKGGESQTFINGNHFGKWSLEMS